MIENKKESAPVEFNPRAFPMDFEFRAPEKGMSLRDYFAAHCPLTFTEFLAGWKFSATATTSEALKAWAEIRTDYAAGMLSARIHA